MADVLVRRGSVDAEVDEEFFLAYEDEEDSPAKRTGTKKIGMRMKIGRTTKSGMMRIGMRTRIGTRTRTGKNSMSSQRNRPASSAL